MKYIICPMLGVLFGELYVDGYHLAAAAIAFIAGLWCAWPERKGTAMNTHQHTPPQRSRYNMGYRTCPNCDFQFTPESDDQTTCTLCQTAAVFRAREPRGKQTPHTVTCGICSKQFPAHTHNAQYCVDCRPRRRSERRYGAKEPRPCLVCGVVFWPRSNAAKYCYNPECKKVGLDKAEAKRQAKRKEAA